MVMMHFLNIVFCFQKITNYQQEGLIIGENFLKTSRDRNLDIRNIVDIKLCGRQELALRGTADSGPIFVKGDEPVVNDGNFRAILRMRIKCGDENLIKYVGNVLNASYISPKIQNEFITICGEIIQ